MATSLQVRPQPFEMGVHNRDGLIPALKQEHGWSELAPECMELLSGFDLSRAQTSTSSSDQNPSQLWGSTPGITMQVMDGPSVLGEYEQNSKDLKGDGVEMAILTLKSTSGLDEAKTSKPTKKKRAKKKADLQQCVSPKDVSPPPKDMYVPRKAKRAMDPDVLADKRARNKVAAEKCRRKRLARVATTEAENVQLKVQVLSLQEKLNKIKDSMRAVIAKTDGGKRNNETVPAMLMDILMNL